MLKLNVWRIGMAVASLMVVSAGASASVQFDTGDCDSVIGISDLVDGVCSEANNSVYSIDVLFNAADTSGGVTGTDWAMRISAIDAVEVDYSAPWDFEFASGVNGSFNDRFFRDFRFLNINYSLDFDLADGDLIGSFVFTTGVLGIKPDDDQSDLLLSSSTSTVFDPATGAFAQLSGIDLQTVPVPASVLLLMGGLGALAGLRRRS